MIKRVLASSLLLLCLLPTVAQAGVYEDLIKAVEQNDGAEVTTLLRRGADPNTADADGTTLLMTAARNSNEELIDLLLQMRAKVRGRNRYGDDALLLASFRGYLNIVRKLVAAGAPIDREEGWQPLAYAAFNGHLEVAKFLLEHEADVDALSDNGTSALMVAARNGHLEVVKLLLKYEADPDIENDAGGTALSWAEAAGNSEIAKLVRKAMDASAADRREAARLYAIRQAEEARQAAERARLEQEAKEKAAAEAASKESSPDPIQTKPE
jgi:hypothetical protein